MDIYHNIWCLADVLIQPVQNGGQTRRVLPGCGCEKNALRVFICNICRAKVDGQESGAAGWQSGERAKIRWWKKQENLQKKSFFCG